jgi:protein-L-isoaspartate(D-aspartate) O-methyltransferase
MAMTHFDYEQARFNMVEQQIRTWEVLDQRVLDLLFAVKREDFVPPAYRALAFADLELPLANGARMWTPKMEARVIQELTLGPDDRVLEIGTGSGYLTALLASAAGEVTSVEIDAATAAEARTKLARHGFMNARVEVGDGARGFGNETCDVIVLTGSTPLLPDRFFEQLVPGGRVFAVVGELPVMSARLIRWQAPGAMVATDLFETVVAPLVNAAAPPRFEF